MLPTSSGLTSRPQSIGMRNVKACCIQLKKTTAIMYLSPKDSRSGLARRCSAAINGAGSARSSYFLAALGGVVERLIRLFVFDCCTSWKMGTVYQRMVHGTTTALKAAVAVYLVCQLRVAMLRKRYLRNYQQARTFYPMQAWATGLAAERRPSFRAPEFEAGEHPAITVKS